MVKHATPQRERGRNSGRKRGKNQLSMTEGVIKKMISTRYLPNLCPHETLAYRYVSRYRTTLQDGAREIEFPIQIYIAENFPILIDVTSITFLNYVQEKKF